MKGKSGTLIALLVAAAAPVLAHHLITEVYDVTRAMTISGSVERVVLKNPHTFVHLSVLDDEGRTRTWAVELEGATKLRRQGIDSKTFTIGDEVTVCGNPGRDASQYRLLMLELRRPGDGFAASRRVEESEAGCTP